MSHATYRRSARRGFTLMELLVVLAILVLLMAMVAPRFIGVEKKANLKAAKSQIGLFRGALERYALDMKDFPSTDQGLQALVEAPSSSGGDRGGMSERRSESNAEKRSDSKADVKGDLKSDSRDGEKSEGHAWEGPYLNAGKVPKDPWGHDYQYEYPPTHGKGDFPDIWSYGPDGEDGTDDDIVSWTESQKDGESGNADRGRDRESRPEPAPSSSSSRPKES